MRNFILVATAIMLATAAHAQQAQDHAAHHPLGASAPAGAAQGTHAAMMQLGRARMAAPAASGAAMGAGMSLDQMQQKHDRMHKPGGMHERMHGKDGLALGPMVLPPASAASR